MGILDKIREQNAGRVRSPLRSDAPQTVQAESRQYIQPPNNSTRNLLDSTRSREKDVVVGKLVATKILGKTFKAVPKTQEIVNMNNDIQNYNKLKNSIVLDTQESIRKEQQQYDTDYQNRMRELRVKGDKIKADYRRHVDEVQQSTKDAILNTQQATDKMIENLKQSNKATYDKQSNDLAKVCNDNEKIIASFGILQRDIEITLSDEEIAKLNVTNIHNLAISLANQLNDLDKQVLSKNTQTNNPNKVISKINTGNSYADTGLKASAAVALGATSILKSTFGILKGLDSIHNINQKRRLIEDEILKLAKIAKRKQELHANTYKEVDTSRYYKERDEIIKDIQNKAQETVNTLKTQYKNSLQELSQEEADLTRSLLQSKRQMENNIADFKKKMQTQVIKIDADILKTNHLISDKFDALKNEQEKFTKREDDIIPASKKIKEIKDKLDDVNTYLQIRDFNLNIDDLPPEEDDPTVIDMHNYDLELYKQIQKYEKMYNELGVLDDIQHYKDKLEEDYKFAQEHVTNYYKSTMSNLILGDITDSACKELNKDFQEKVLSDFNNNSILVLYKNRDEEVALVNFIKYIVQQFLYVQHPEGVIVNILEDAFSGMFNDLQVSLDVIKNEELIKGRPYVTLYSDMSDINRQFEDEHNYLKDMYNSDLAQASYTEMINTRIEKGAKIPPIYLNILHRMKPDSSFFEFVENSINTGIINIQFLPVKALYKNGKDDEIDESTIELIKDYKKIIEVVPNTLTADKCQISCTSTTQSTLSEYFFRSHKEIENFGKILRQRALDIKHSFRTTDEFIEYIVKVKGGYWKYNADKRILLYPGPVEGDMSNIQPTILDEDIHPHMFFAGVTGAGKSVTLNHIENVLKACYAPSDVQIIHFDFKIAEVAIHAAPYKTPHALALCGSTCGEYVASLCRFLLDEMYRRYALAAEYHTSNLSGIRKKQREMKQKLIDEGRIEEANKIKILPRIIIIFDEAAQGFKLEDTDAASTYKEIAIKLGEMARAAGMHMIIVTQTASKIPADLAAALAVRGCTRATPEVSKSVLDINIAAEAANQFIGFFCAGYKPIKENKDVKKYVVPYCSPDTTKRLDRILYEKALKEDVYYDAVIFNDNIPYKEADLKRYIRQSNYQFNGRNFLLGEPAIFQLEFKPLEITIPIGSQENLIITSTNVDRLEALFKTVYYCIKDVSEVRIFPVFTKTIPSYFDLDAHIKKGGTYIAGPNIAPKEHLQANIVDQFGKGDIFKNKTSERYKKDFLWHVNQAINANATKMQKGEKPRLFYYIIFDLEQADALSSGAMSWSNIVQVFNSAPNNDVHFILVSTNVNKITYRDYYKHCITGLPGPKNSVPDQTFKNIPESMSRYINKSETSLNTTFKQVTY